MSLPSADKIDQAIEVSRRLSDSCEERNYDKLSYSNPYDRQIERLSSLKDFLQFDVKVEDLGNGTVLVNDKYIFALRSFKWKVKGKNTWYKSRDPEQFLTKYVKAKPKEKNNENNS